VARHYDGGLCIKSFLSLAEKISSMSGRNERGDDEAARLAGLVTYVSLSEVPYYLDRIAERTPLLLGPPGVGKSSVVRQYAERKAKEAGREFIQLTDQTLEAVAMNLDSFYVFFDVRLSEYVESDFLGFPEKRELLVEEAGGYARQTEVVARYSPMAWAYIFTHPAAVGLILFDEITNVVKPELQSIAFKIVLDRQIGERRISEGVRIVAAGNLPEHSSVAQALPAPLINRFAILYIKPPELEKWLSYIEERRGGLHPLVAGFLARSAGEAFLKLPADPETVYNFPSPRSWDAFNADITRLAREHGAGNDPEILRYVRQVDLQVIAQAHLGPELAQELVAFAMLGKYVPSYDEVAADPSAITRAADRAEAESRDGRLVRVGVIYYTLSYVAKEAARRQDRETVSTVAAYLAQVGSEYRAAFNAMLPSSLRAQAAEAQRAAGALERLKEDWAAALEQSGRRRRR